MSGKQQKRRLTRVTAGGSALLLGVALLPVGLMASQPANAAGVGAGLAITPDDLAFILKQIQISEAHATKERCTRNLGRGQPDPPYLRIQPE